jgi:hypothetical protein
MQAFRVKLFGGVNPASPFFERVDDGQRVLPDQTRVDLSGATVFTFFESLRPFTTVRIGARNFHTVTVDTGPPVFFTTPTENIRYVGLNHLWPYEVGWVELRGTMLDDGDIISAEITENVARPEVVEFALASNLWWWKELNVPDGETGSSWNIHTGAVWFGGRRFEDRTALWAHQVHNGQFLSFRKAKTFGLVSTTYLLGQLNVLKPGSRVTFRWLRDTA